MKTKLIIIIQFILIVFLSVFAMLKMVEGNKHRESAVVSAKIAREYERQNQINAEHLKECQKNKIK